MLTTHESARRVVRQRIEPLCKATADLFRPCRFDTTDRLHIALDKTGRHFVCRAYRYVIDEPLPPITGIWLSDLGVVRELTLVNSSAPKEQWTTNRRELPASYDASHGWWQRLPEAKRLGHDRVQFPVTDFNALVVNELWPESQLDFEPDAQLEYELLVTRFVMQSKKLEERVAFTTKGVHPEWRHKEAKPFMPHQKIITHVSLNTDFGNTSEQGTGKTPSTIARICTEAEERNKWKPAYLVLIVAPKNVRANWRNEFINWSTCRGAVTILRGGQTKRVEQMIDAVRSEEGQLWSAVICSYETVERSWSAIGMLNWDLVVLDESHYIKNPRTKRWQAIRELRSRSKHRMILTGTPFNNHVGDIWTQLEFLDEGLSGFATYEAFKNYYGKFVPMRRGQRYEGAEKLNAPLLKERLARLTMRVTKKQCLPDLPDKISMIREVYMSKEQRAVYIMIRDKLIAEIERDIATAETKGTSRALVMTNVLTKLLKLAQVTSGFVVFPEELNEEGEVTAPRLVDRFDPNPKVEELINVLKTELDENGKALIWCCWIEDIKIVAARLRIEFGEESVVTYYGATKEDDREIAERRFNEDPKCKFLVGNPAAGGVGLNLVGYPWWEGENSSVKTDCTHMVYFSQDWSMTKRSQSEDRSHRKGTRVPLTIVDLLVPGSIDEQIRQRVTDKRISAHEVQDVTAILQTVADSEVEID